jgi:tetratricopeptide (TPR) repeat protein
VLIAAGGGSNLYMAFNERSRGDSYVQPAFARSGPARLTEDSIAEAARLAGRPGSASEASRFWSREALRYVAGHPARCAGLLAQRLWVSLGNDEISGNYPHGYFSRVNPLIGWNPLCFALIFSLGSVGWWRARGDRGTLIFPAVFLGIWVSFLPFWTLDRFRLPAVLPLIAGSLFAIREIVRLAGRREARRVGTLLAVVALLLAVSLPPRLDARRRAEVVGLAYARGADLYLQDGDLARAGGYLDVARRSPQALPEISLVAARYLAAAGRPEEALRELEVFRAWRRDFEDAELLQARLLAGRGERAAARRVLEAYLASWPGSARAVEALDELRAAADR